MGALALAMMGSSLLSTLLGIRAPLLQTDTTTLGLVMAGYFAGFLASSLVSPRLIRALGHVRAFLALGLLASAMPALHALAPHWPVWLLGRAGSGFAFAGIYIVVESWLNQATGNETRGRLLAVYMVTQGGAWSSGQFLLKAGDPFGALPIVLATMLQLGGAVAVLAARRHRPAQAEIPLPGLRGIGRLPLVGVVGCVGVGVAQGAQGGMGAIWATAIGLSVGEIAWLFGLSSLGGMAMQWPMGWISDRVDRRGLAVAVAGGAILGALAIASGTLGTGVLFFAVYILANGLGFTLYALYLAIVNDRLGPEEMVGASGNLTLLYGAGAIGGPVAGAAAMAALGPGGLFLLMAASLAPFAVLAFLAARRGPRLTGLARRP
jgi:MFS family permease